MTADPIVDDVRRIREALARRADYKVDRIFAAFRESEARPDAEHPLAENADLRPRPAVMREKGFHADILRPDITELFPPGWEERLEPMPGFDGVFFLEAAGQ